MTLFVITSTLIQKYTDSTHMHSHLGLHSSKCCLSVWPHRVDLATVLVSIIKVGPPVSGIGSHSDLEPGRHSFHFQTPICWIYLHVHVSLIRQVLELDPRQYCSSLPHGFCDVKRHIAVSASHQCSCDFFMCFLLVIKCVTRGCVFIMTGSAGLHLLGTRYRLEHKLMGQSLTDIKSTDLPGSCMTV